MSSVDTEAVGIARDYYNSEDADNFYSVVWGGEDIHIGLYHSEEDSISVASRRTQDRMSEKLDTIGTDSHVIDLGSGYGGAARFLAGRFGAKVIALNLSEVENERARTLNREHGLEGQIDVVDGSFEELPYEDESFDVIWSQDAFLHSPSREDVIKESARVLKPGGEFVFTDPMQSDSCPDGVLQPILNRIHLESMATPEFYKKVAFENGLKLLNFDELTHQLKNHYSAVLRKTEKQEEVLRKDISGDYIDNMKAGLNHWIDGADKGYLSWGIFQFQKA